MVRESCRYGALPLRYFVINGAEVCRRAALQRQHRPCAGFHKNNSPAKTERLVLVTVGEF
jgi:hypothetical protein